MSEQSPEPHNKEINRQAKFDFDDLHISQLIAVESEQCRQVFEDLHRALVRIEHMYNEGAAQFHKTYTKNGERTVLVAQHDMLGAHRENFVHVIVNDEPQHGGIRPVYIQEYIVSNSINNISFHESVLEDAESEDLASSPGPLLLPTEMGNIEVERGLSRPLKFVEDSSYFDIQAKRKNAERLYDTLSTLGSISLEPHSRVINPDNLV